MVIEEVYMSKNPIVKRVKPIIFSYIPFPLTVKVSNYSKMNYRVPPLLKIYIYIYNYRRKLKGINGERYLLDSRNPHNEIIHTYTYIQGYAIIC